MRLKESLKSKILVSKHSATIYTGYIERGNKIWYAENFSAYGVTSILLLFCAEAPYNFLEREIGMKREVIVGKTFPIHFHS